MRNSSVQAVSLIVANAIQLVSVLVVAAYLGPAEMARFALLIFLAGLVAQVLSLLVKPGTVRRTFGGDDEDDDDDDDAAASSSPPRTLGTGLVWALVLGALGTALVYVFREPIADGLLGDPEDEGIVALAGLLGGVLLVFKIADIVLWLERRPGAYLIADTSRPLLGLAVLTVLLAGGSGVEGALVGTLIGTAVAGVVALVLLSGSFEPNLNFGEVKQIIIAGRYRAPIVMSFWLIQNADIFLLSRFLDHHELGIYTLASRLGFVVAFLPQGFRMGMRPLRKSAMWDAFQEQYGKQTAGGQLLAYFSLICILAVLAMVLGGSVLVDLAPPEYADAAALLPFTALGFIMPPLYRTVNQNVNLPNKRPWFIGGVIGAAVLFIVVTCLLAPEIDAYAAPVGMIVGFGIPATLLFVRGQRGKKPLHFPYREVITAIVLAAVIAAGFEALPEFNQWLELLVAGACCALWMALLAPLRAIPKAHWKPLTHMLFSFRRGTAANFRARKGLRGIDDATRDELREAVVVRLPRERLDPEASDLGARMVAALRKVGNHGGVPCGRPTRRDPEIAYFLFQDSSTAVRGAAMRAVLEKDVDPNQLRALEDLVKTLSRVPVEAWEDRPVERGYRGRRRRAAAQLRERAAKGT